MSACYICEEREAVAFQGGRCRTCIRLAHERLSPAEALAVATLVTEVARQAREDEPLFASHLLVIAAKLQSRQKGSWFLSQEQRAIVADLLRAAAVGCERESGEPDPNLEHLYRQVTGQWREATLAPTP